MADTGVVDLDTDLVGLWGCNLDVLDREFLASFPRNGGLLYIFVSGVVRA